MISSSSFPVLRPNSRSFVVGGTSVSAPSLSGIINAAGGFRTGSAAENQEIYSRFERGFNDIFYGSRGAEHRRLRASGIRFVHGSGLGEWARREVTIGLPR